MLALFFACHFLSCYLLACFFLLSLRSFLVPLSALLLLLQHSLPINHNKRPEQSSKSQLILASQSQRISLHLTCLFVSLLSSSGNIYHGLTATMAIQVAIPAAPFPCTDAFPPRRCSPSIDIYQSRELFFNFLHHNLFTFSLAFDPMKIWSVDTWHTDFQKAVVEYPVEPQYERLAKKSMKSTSLVSL
jgi:hypothetical protein